MSVAGILGAPGAGKTTFAVEREILPWLRDGGIICTNISLKLERFVQEFGQEFVDGHVFCHPFSQHKFPDYSFSDMSWFDRYIEKEDDKGRAPKFVIDEAHKLYPKRMQTPVDKKTGKPDMTAFGNQLLQLMTDSRHYLSNFVFITQSPDFLAPFLFEVMHSCVFIENSESKGKSNGYTVKIWNGPPPARTLKALKSIKAVVGGGVDDSEGFPLPKTYNSESWEFFISQSKKTASENAAKLGLTGRALEGNYSRGRSIWRQPLVLAMIPVLLVLVFFVFKIMHDVSPKKPSASVSAQKSPHKAPQRVSKPGTVDGGARAIDSLSEPLPGSLADDPLKGYRIYLVSSDWEFKDGSGRVGPLVGLDDDGGRRRFYALADLVSGLGFELGMIPCGFELKQGVKVRHRIFDNECLKGLISGSGGQTNPEVDGGISTSLTSSSGSSKEDGRRKAQSQGTSFGPWDIGRRRDGDILADGT